jgi:3-deoxy-D-manno-octulosonate 8-phosphate phosphatase (KDO 8-P phosphatase)
MNQTFTNCSPDSELGQLLAGIKLLSLDVDGVLTDGGLYYAEDGGIQRKFNVRDGVGIVRLREAGVPVTIISAGASGSIPSRAETLGIPNVFTAVADKLATLKSLCAELGVELTEVAHIGDDINDVPLMAAIGLPISVADASPEAREAARIVTANGGGKGAVREVCDALIRVQGNG